MFADILNFLFLPLLLLKDTGKQINPGGGLVRKKDTVVICRNLGCNNILCAMMRDEFYCLFVKDNKRRMYHVTINYKGNRKD